jgi:hypothetical protein
MAKIKSTDNTMAKRTSTDNTMAKREVFVLENKKNCMVLYKYTSLIYHR